LGEKKLNTIDALLQLIDTLRGENGCPWDRKQTAASMAVYLAEEVHELIEAIEKGRSGEVCEELGDVLFLLLFILRFYDTRDLFNLEQVIEQVAAKMIRRHPHIFGDSQADTASQVKRQWQEIKKTEKTVDRYTSCLDSIPSGLPALLRAFQVSERASQAGFDWPDLAGVMDKVGEECDECNRELECRDAGNPSSEKLALEFGDILFTLANVARFAGFHPETALTGAVNKFEQRFRLMESILEMQGLEMGSVSQAKLDALWAEVKKQVGLIVYSAFGLSPLIFMRVHKEKGIFF